LIDDQGVASRCHPRSIHCVVIALRTPERLAARDRSCYPRLGLAFGPSSFLLVAPCTHGHRTACVAALYGARYFLLHRWNRHPSDGRPPLRLNRMAGLEQAQRPTSPPPRASFRRFCCWHSAGPFTGRVFTGRGQAGGPGTSDPTFSSALFFGGPDCVSSSASGRASCGRYPRDGSSSYEGCPSTHPGFTCTRPTIQDEPLTTTSLSQPYPTAVQHFCWGPPHAHQPPLFHTARAHCCGGDAPGPGDATLRALAPTDGINPSTGDRHSKRRALWRRPFGYCAWLRYDRAGGCERWW